MTVEQLKKFLNDHPSIKHRPFAEECGVSYRMFGYILSGERQPSDKIMEKIENRARHYGYQTENNY